MAALRSLISRPAWTSVFHAGGDLAVEVAALVKVLVGEDAEELVVKLAAGGDREGRIAGAVDDLDNFGDGLLGGEGENIGLKSRP